MNATQTIATDEQKKVRFLSWLREQGATFPSLEIRSENGLRGLYATANLAKGELAYHIPRHLIITEEIAQNSAIGRKMKATGAWVSSWGYVAAFLLENHREDGFWKPYVDMLPDAFSEMRMFYLKSHMARMKGSRILPLIEQFEFKCMQKTLLHNYRLVKPHLPSLSLHEFSTMVNSVRSRRFSIEIDGCETVGMVPLADMLNHAWPMPTRWNGNATHGFSCVALQEIGAGKPVLGNYGRKCNSEWLLTHGFCVENNADNLCEIEFPAIKSAHPFFRLTAEWLEKWDEKSGEMHRRKRLFTVPQNASSIEARHMFSYLRLACQEDMPALRHAIHAVGKRTILPAVSRQNELAALRMLAAGCARSLERYDTSLEEDEAVLADPDLAWTMRLAVMIGCGEKRILKYYAGLAAAAAVALDSPCAMQAALAEEARDGKPYAGYFKEIVQAFPCTDMCTPFAPPTHKKIPPTTQNT